MSRKYAQGEEVTKNRNLFLARLKITPEEVIEAQLEGRDKIILVSQNDRGQVFDCDCLITKDSNTALWMVVADCYATLVYDGRQNILGLVHLGRNGLDLGLTDKAVDKFKELGSNVEDLQVIASPGIKKESYLWEGKLPFVKDWGEYVQMGEDGKYRIDSAGFLKQQFLNNGVLGKNIIMSDVDVYKDENYFSHVRSWKYKLPEKRFATVAILSD